MPICTLKEVLDKTMGEDYAVPAFNVHNLEFIQGVMQAAEELRAPVILLLHPASIRYAGFEQLVAIARSSGESSEVPTVVHLDHCGDMDLIKRSINEGFTSVMFDGSGLPFEENVEKTKKIVKMAEANGVSVEADGAGSWGRTRGNSSVGLPCPFCVAQDSRTVKREADGNSLPFGERSALGGRSAVSGQQSAFSGSYAIAIGETVMSITGSVSRLTA